MVNGKHSNDEICAQTGCCSWAAKICIIQALTAHQSELPERMNKLVAMVLGQDDVKVSCQVWGSSAAVLRYHPRYLS